MQTYGNVPEPDAKALQKAVRIASSVILSLPGLCPPGWRELAYEIVLDGILNDWVANGTTELEADDEEDLSNILRLCADIALSQDDTLRDATFRILLHNGMTDWTENWNTEEEE